METPSAMPNTPSVVIHWWFTISDRLLPLWEMISGIIGPSTVYIRNTEATIISAGPSARRVASSSRMMPSTETTKSCMIGAPTRPEMSR